MQETVEGLNKKETNIWIYSNIIPLLTEVVKQKLIEYYPSLDPKRIIFSCERGVPKQSDGSYAKIANTLGRGEILFIDDLETYTTKARASGSMRGFTFRGNPYGNISPQKRLTDELKSAGLI